MKHASIGRKLRGVLAFAAACLVGVAGFSAPAVAAPLASEIDPLAKGSINLLKWSTPAGQESNKPQNGAKDDTAPSTGSVPLQGATFQLYRLTSGTNPDLTTNAGWEWLQNVRGGMTTNNPTVAQLATAGFTVTPVGGAQVTGSDGKINWTGLDIGLYYVAETSVPAGHKASAPFLVTIPMTDPVNRDKWVYDVYVYPKNLKDDSAKVPLDLDVPKPGDPLTWEISTNVPGSGTNYVTTMRFEDTLSNDLVFSPGPPSPVTLKVGGTTFTNSPYQLQGTDYVMDWNSVTRKLTVTINSDGLKALNGQGPWPDQRGKRLFLRIDTTVGPNYVGALNNQANIITNKPGTTEETTTTTPQSLVKYGKVTVNKVDEKDQPLSGATFKVYYTHVKYTSVPSNPVTGDPKTGMKDTGVTCVMNGGKTSCDLELRYSDFAENTQLAEPDSRWNYYYLKEMTSPNGYVVLPGFIPFQITKDNTNGNTHVSASLKVKNVKDIGGFELPFVGGPGTAAFMVLGLSVLAGSAVLAVRRTRRNRVSIEV
ncbi:isopeptide-forming domain-containing fimbrial protein [Leucobacter insecticola]|uniref:Isopeptide-forming domain-containing fimbrial protein n=1 Tax=Leucobacter insecticola TaxID=2714934 RepID=A0A6G8FHE4_9MICO|nr:SpaH/EbpB family LPXTG-anchored major pilin [Leucobacter insecticola]QIM15781.1 isopeptide-forming domain-containing fimbrial protein [Leucobacter insecticola]